MCIDLFVGLVHDVVQCVCGGLQHSRQHTKLAAQQVKNRNESRQSLYLGGDLVAAVVRRAVEDRSVLCIG